MSAGKGLVAVGIVSLAVGMGFALFQGDWSGVFGAVILGGATCVGYECGRHDAE